MRGVTFKGNREAEIQEFPDPHAGPGDAVPARTGVGAVRLRPAPLSGR